MTTAERIAVLDRFLPRIAAALGLPSDRAPSVLSREQIAQVAGLGSAKSLTSSASRGVQRGDPRWTAYRAIVGQGAHRVPVERVAEWLAVWAGVLPMPAVVAEDDAAHASAMPTPSLEHAWASGRGRVNRCLGGG